MQYLKVDPHSGARWVIAVAQLLTLRQCSVLLKVGSGYLRSGPLQSEDASMKNSVPVGVPVKDA
jgi:hypothetical protein